ncbi:MAG: hypothetical protein C4551_08330 [Bacillota bacterium]|nr:MAG: hypothetical protein C4551_08330 [Bacillota bacterium]
MYLVAIAVALVLFSVFRLTTRYEYGPASRRLLLVGLGGSIALGLVLAPRLFTLSGGYYYLAALAVALLVYVFVALATAEAMRKAKQRVYDERLAALREREQALLRELESVNRQVRAELRQRQEAERSGRETEDRLEGHRRTVEAWKRAGGAARVRTIKIEEWDAEFRSLPPSELQDRRASLVKELETVSDPERRSQVEAMLSVLALAAESSRNEAVAGEVRTVDENLSGCIRRRREIEEELGRVRSEIDEWQRRLTDFLSKEIRLD